ncbi:85/88 kDa calcium-independent phospholipase A2-like [Dreissena polymorpha]|uniref:85/88 kDa calcium-independent phospholipase A2-like n=1 Tax=Dreissena polymorpha TaxID=45954 RepID=UPI0022643953|nr:85/88 kDa calcium-independent phospholipase A2-like [Dreissena polymorpha]
MESTVTTSEWTMDAGDRVLSLDGGGIRGLIILEILDAIEKEAEKEIKDLFDWIGGTSTGGIIALGIATGKSVSEIRAIYYRLKDQVFKGSTPYDSATIENLLQTEFGDKVMTDIKKPKVLVTSVLGDHHPWKLHMFCSYKEDEKPEEDPDFEPIKPPDETYIWEVARSTSAAPTYFPPYKQFFDGGIMSNNPTLDILTEIQEYKENQKDKSRVRLVVSIGCGYVKYAKQTAPNPKVPKLWDVLLHPINTYRSLDSSKRFFMDLLEQVAISHGQPSYRTRAWCHMMDVPFFRFSPLLVENVPLDCVDDSVLEKMRQDTRDYIKTPEHFDRITILVSYLKAGPYVKSEFWGDGQRNSIENVPLGCVGGSVLGNWRDNPSVLEGYRDRRRMAVNVPPGCVEGSVLENWRDKPRMKTGSVLEN